MVKVDWKKSVAALSVLMGVGFCFRYSTQVQARHRPRVRRDSSIYGRSIGGFQVQLVAVKEDIKDGIQRVGDHSWMPDGFPYEGSEQRLAHPSLAGSVDGGTPRNLVFEVEESPRPTKLPAKPIPTTSLDVMAWLPTAGIDPNSARIIGPSTIQLWHGLMRDSAGKEVSSEPTSITFAVGVRSTETQPVSFGIAHGEFKVTHSGAASVRGLAENQTAILGSGPWGRIEATHLPRSWAESKPSPTHRFRLRGGPFPPKSERTAIFFDAKGRSLASCGDGPNNAGSTGRFYMTHVTPDDIVRYEIRERPIYVVKFDEVCFERPEFANHSGQQGLDFTVDSAVGKVLGIIRSQKKGPWMGSVLYAADGVRWIDPGKEIDSYDSGGFDPWNRTQEEQWNIVLEPQAKFAVPQIPVMTQIFAADSPTGPTKEPLTVWDAVPFRLPITTIPCRPTKRPFIVMQVRVGDGTWKTFESIAVTPRMYLAAREAPARTRILGVYFDENGTIQIWKDEPNPVTIQPRWQPAEQRIRVIAHLRSGKDAEVNFNISGAGGMPPNERKYRGIEYTRQSNGTFVQSGNSSIDFKDILSFQLQTQDLNASKTIAIRTPLE